MLALVSVQTMVAQQQVRIEELRQDTAAEQQRYEKLRLRVAELSSPARIVGQATDFGMQAPTGPSPVVAVPPTSTATSGDETTTTQDWEEVKDHLDTRP